MSWAVSAAAALSSSLLWLQPSLTALSALGPTHAPSSEPPGAALDAASAGTGAPLGTLGSDRLVLPRFFFLMAAGDAAAAPAEAASVLGVPLAWHSRLWPCVASRAVKGRARGSLGGR